jgi:hypothetical protein
MFTPVKLITVIEEVKLCDRVAVTDTFAKTVGAKARQISEVPSWVLVLTTRTQVRPAPVTLLTVVFVPELGPSVEIKVNNNSLADFVEKVDVVTV